MSAFRKTGENLSKINGTKVKNSLPCISTGIPSLDHIIGGSVPAGTIFMIEEDVLRNYCRVMCKYFMAEGVVCNHDLFVASLDDIPNELIKELPVPTTVDTEKPSESTIDSEKMQIAWRYESLGPVESSFGANTHFGHHFDLSRHMDEDMINQCHITCWDNSANDKDDSTMENKSGFTNIAYFNLLKTIKELLTQSKYQLNSKEKQNIVRISISSLGSPMWTAHESDDYEPGQFGRDLLRFMYCLRVVLRDTTAVALITVPSHLFGDGDLTKRILYSVDNAVKLESFAGSSRETNPVFKEYHGLFHITKLSAINSLVPYLPPSLDLAFKLRRKKFLIEKLHLPPELQDSSEREQDDITATPSCGGFKKGHIDF